MTVPGVAWDQILTLLAPLPLALLANFAERSRALDRVERTADGPPPALRTPSPREEGRESDGDVKRGTIPAGWVGFVCAPGALGLFTWAVLLVIALAFLLLGAATALLAPVSARSDTTRVALFGLLEAAFATAAAATLLRPVRVWLARVLPLDADSPVHTTALVLSTLLFGTQAATQLTTNVLGQVTAGRQLQPVDLIVQEIPFLLLAFVGVGVFVRRDFGQALRRLGLVRPQPYQVLLALAAAGAFYGFSTGMDALAQRLTPDLSRQVGAASQRLFGQLGSPLGIATIALAAGVCEEALFRGGLQPRLGLVWTALLFTAVHSEYGVSLDVLAVFILAVALGLIRWFTNTTTSATCHVAYNALVGVGLLQTWAALPAIGAEVVLLAATAGTWFFTTKVGDAQGTG